MTQQQDDVRRILNDVEENVRFALLSDRTDQEKGKLVLNIFKAFAVSYAAALTSLGEANI